MIRELNPTQLEWCRVHIRPFADMEATAQRVKREQERSRDMVEGKDG